MRLLTFLALRDAVPGESAFQGAWFAVIGVPSFVVTLAGFLVWQGVQLRVLGSTGTINVFETHIAKIAQSYLPGYWGWIIGTGCAAGYAAATWAAQVRRRAMGLAAEPLAVTTAKTIVVAAIAVAAVEVLADHAHPVRPLRVRGRRQRPAQDRAADRPRPPSRLRAVHPRLRRDTPGPGHTQRRPLAASGAAPASGPTLRLTQSGLFHV